MENHVKEAIILAGGLGTRLRSEIGEYPKPMAEVNGKPFLHYLFNYLKSQKINSVVLSVGYKWEIIEAYFGAEYMDIKIQYAVENERLGTGGGIKLALEKIKSDNCFVLNGDTFFKVDLAQISAKHSDTNAESTLALKELSNVDRYGLVELENEKIVAFKEKEFREKTIINGGIYLINKNCLNEFPPLSNFSFETDYLEKNTREKNICGIVFDEYFKDIGIPEDYHQFEKDIQ